LFITGPDPDFLPILDPGVKKAPKKALFTLMELLLFFADRSSFSFDVDPDPDFYLQCCGSRIFMLDPGFDFFPSRIQDPTHLFKKCTQKKFFSQKTILPIEN
jgi:hypothetical protein